MVDHSLDHSMLLEIYKIVLVLQMPHKQDEKDNIMLRAPGAGGRVRGDRAIHDTAGRGDNCSCPRALCFSGFVCL